MATVFVHARLIDGTGRDPRDDASVRVDDNRITGLDVMPHRDDAVVDLQGRTLMPGIINAHSHLGGVALLQEDTVPAAVIAAWTFEHCRRALELGITTCRDTGGLDGGVPMAISQGIARGPRIIPSGPLIVQLGGHTEFRPEWVMDPCVHHQGVPGLARFSHVVTGPDEVRAAARLAFKRGAKFLKLCVSGGVTSLTDSLEDSQLTVEEISAAVQEARARHTYVTVHTHNNEGIYRGLEAGVECFEHVTALDDEAAAAIAESGAAVVPTLTVAETYRNNADFLPTEVIDRIAGVKEGMSRAIKVAHAAGVLVGCGADLIGPNQKDYGLEVALVADIVGPMQAIRTATFDNARVLRIEHQTGSVQTGKLADLIVVNEDPLDNPRALNDPNRIALVMKAGAIEKNILEA
ncbi:amidohydrolase family protein [Kribbella turkmenica]|uniref:Amidohydrolase family protein n=1 Tax=Kribbella turkmenica TaxID=2530375 RepID=A0A4R4XGV8_9ACTN|nr:amidohydrolase family protein [Kribbella turkmenica]TDD30010.1 amidohydrolase family protein [Kribbella turkmenica]